MSNYDFKNIEKKDWRREWDSNPRPLAESLVFKTSSLNHSDTSPCNNQYNTTTTSTMSRDFSKNFARFFTLFTPLFYFS